MGLINIVQSLNKVPYKLYFIYSNKLYSGKTLRLKLYIQNKS